MKAIEYTTEIRPDGTFKLPPLLLRDLQLKDRAQIRVLLLFEEPRSGKLTRFAGQWQDDRSADQIVGDIYAGREQMKATA
jgi:hypothetical protein